MMRREQFPKNCQKCKIDDKLNDMSEFKKIEVDCKEVY